MAMRLSFESQLGAESNTVWDAVACMSGVNDELRPLVRMTYPPGCDRLESDNRLVLAGFRSWVLLLGVLPIDRHHFGFEEIVDGERFTERSDSWLNRSWRHGRVVSSNDAPGGAVLRDELEIEPRLRALEPFVRLGVGSVFRHRHRRLLKRFGEVS